MYDILQLNQKTVADLKEIAKELDIKKYQKLKKEDLIYTILDQQAIKPKSASADPKKSNGEDKKVDKPSSSKKPSPKESDKSDSAEKKVAYPKKPASERTIKPKIQAEKKA